MTSEDEKSMTKNMGSVATASEASRKSKKEQFIKSNKTSKVKVVSNYMIALPCHSTSSLKIPL